MPVSSSEAEGLYIHGHHDPILRRWSGRTPQNSAAFLLPHLKPDTELLDVGCGSGTIPAGFAGLCSSGSVVGVDIGVNAVRHASETVHAPNISFQVASAHELPFEDGSFDIVHTHRVFIYLADAPITLREMRRVLRPGGLVALRDSLFDEAAVEPRHPGLHLFMRLVPESYAVSGGDPHVARRMPQLLRDAGFELVHRSASAVFVDGDALPAFAQDWVQLLTRSPMLDTWRRQGIFRADEAILKEGMNALGSSGDGFMLSPTIEVIGEK